MKKLSTVTFRSWRSMSATIIAAAVIAGVLTGLQLPVAAPVEGHAACKAANATCGDDNTKTAVVEVRRNDSPITYGASGF